MNYKQHLGTGLLLAAVLLLLGAFGGLQNIDSQPVGAETNRQMALTIDDMVGVARQADDATYAYIVHNILKHVQAHRLKAYGFVNAYKCEPDGQRSAARVQLLIDWLEAGQPIGNHTYSHPSLHRTPVNEYLADLRRGEELLDSLLAPRGQQLRYFRHPYLQTGRTLEDRDAVRADLASRGQQVAPVTLDNSEWIFARAYDNAHLAGDTALKDSVGRAYVTYMLEKTIYFEGRSQALLGRNVNHVLLIHFNRLNADWLGTLLDAHAELGYAFVSLEQALEDPAYTQQPNTYTGGWGISWLDRWAITAGKEGAFFAGEPRTPQWIQDVSGIEE